MGKINASTSSPAPIWQVNRPLSAKSLCIAILAQMGSFVPAKRAHIGIIDKVFSRIGASDDLSRGQSTFMVEMTETANILHNATKRSL